MLYTKEDLINSVIKIPEGYEDVLSILYPNMVVRDFVNALNYREDVIFTGKLKNPEIILLKYTNSYISLTGATDKTLTRNDLLETCLGRDLKKRELNYLSHVEDEDFICMCKLACVTGKLNIPQRLDVSIYNLFEATLEPTYSLVDTYLKLLEAYPLKVIESSYITFLDRVVNLNLENVKPKYGIIIKNANSKVSNYIRKSVDTYFKSERKELDFLNLLLGLRGVK